VKVSDLTLGSFGEVWECEHKPSQNKRAVKIMKRDLLLSGHEFERIFTEVEILKQLDHPNIIKIFEMF